MADAFASGGVPQPPAKKHKRTTEEVAAGGGAILVSRTQFPVLPKMQCTLHGVQGKTADPSFIAHWTFPLGLMKRQWESNHCE